MRSGQDSEKPPPVSQEVSTVGAAGIEPAVPAMTRSALPLRFARRRAAATVIDTDRTTAAPLSERTALRWTAPGSLDTVAFPEWIGAMKFTAEVEFDVLMQVYRYCVEREHGPRQRFILDSIDRFYEFGGTPQPWNFVKMLSLKALLEERRPKVVVDLGLGLSTLIMAKYAQDYDARVVGVDHNPQWAAGIESLIPQARRDGRVDFRIFDWVRDPDAKPYALSYYDMRLDVPAEFVHVDGPPIEVDGHSPADVINTNVFDIVDDHGPETVVVDWRLATAREFAARMANRYRAELSSALQGFEMTPNGHDKFLGITFRYFSEFSKST